METLWPTLWRRHERLVHGNRTRGVKREGDPSLGAPLHVKRPVAFQDLRRPLLPEALRDGRCRALRRLPLTPRPSS